MKAVILAGGLGTRLEPFTKIIPKPLLPVGESSVLEIQIASLKKNGFKEIFIATNYKSKYVETFLGDGKEYGVKLIFSKETKPLGTVGPLSLLRERLTEPFLLMNGDVLTTFNFASAYKKALKLKANLTVVTKQIVAPFDFGFVTSKGNYLLNVEEKPKIRQEIIAGIYILKPPVFDVIPNGKYYNMDTLIKDLLSKDQNVGKFLMNSYWLDIGRVTDYDIAQEAYKKHFTKYKYAKRK